MQQRPRILFSDKPEWRAALFANADPARYEVVMQDLTGADLAAFDMVVPLSIADQDLLGRRTPAPAAILVPPRVRQLCHDKPQLNRQLAELGFGAHVPRQRAALPDDLARHPVIVKPRKGAFGRDAAILRGGPVPEIVTGWLRDGTHFVQDYVAGRLELATHVLMHRGIARFWLTREYDMGESHRVNGASAEPVGRRWLEETPEQALWLRMLRAIGFTDGSACIDYRMVDGKPVLFEINPRFGGSLMWRINPYLKAYAACLRER